MKPSTDRCFCGRLLEQCDEWVCIIESRSRAALSAGERADLPEVRGEPAMPVDGPTLAPHGERTQGKPQSIGGTPEMSARPGYRVPALERRYPPGCPDPDWCAGNNVCYLGMYARGPDLDAAPDIPSECFYPGGDACSWVEPPGVGASDGRGCVDQPLIARS